MKYLTFIYNLISKMFLIVDRKMVYIPPRFIFFIQYTTEWDCNISSVKVMWIVIVAWMNLIFQFAFLLLLDDIRKVKSYLWWYQKSFGVLIDICPMSYSPLLKHTCISIKWLSIKIYHVPSLILRLYKKQHISQESQIPRACQISLKYLEAVKLSQVSSTEKL